LVESRLQLTYSKVGTIEKTGSNVSNSYKKHVLFSANEDNLIRKKNKQSGYHVSEPDRLYAQMYSTMSIKETGFKKVCFLGGSFSIPAQDLCSHFFQGPRWGPFVNLSFLFFYEHSGFIFPCLVCCQEVCGSILHSFLFFFL
jgi:hypothetical protein